MPHVRVAHSILEFDREQWDCCFPGELEAWDYYRAVEEAGLAGFRLRYPSIWHDGRPITLAPAFLTTYRLDTTLTGRWKRLTNAISRRFPRLLSLPMACLGSPVGEICHVGFAEEALPAERPALLVRLMDGFADHAAREGIHFVAVKDAPDAEAALWEACMSAGYQRIPSLPTAVLPLPFASFDDYLASLSRATRKDLRRKMRAGDRLVIEWRQNIDDVLPEVMEIYGETLARAEMQFEELPADYFRAVLGQLGNRAACVLYWSDGVLIGFNLLLRNQDRLMDKFLGMRAELGRRHNLYFLSWLHNVQYCIANGIPLYQSGQAGYAVKRRLGSRLLANWLFFRHRKPWLNALLRLVGQLVRVDRHDEDVADALEAVP